MTVLLLRKGFANKRPGRIPGNAPERAAGYDYCRYCNDAKILELARAEAIDFVKNNNIDDYPLLKEAKGLNFDGDLFGAG